MSKQAFETFRQSMELDYEAYHNGYGYDLAALASLTAEELIRAEDLLIAQNLADWRDIEALNSIGSPRALAEVQKALNATPIVVRMQALELLAQRQLVTEQDIETSVVNALDDATILNGMVATLRIAKDYPTPRIRKKLLWCALHGNDDIRVHAAALVHFLYGCSSSDFDWSYRDFYLNFQTDDMVERKFYYDDLCARIATSQQTSSSPDAHKS